MQCEWLVLAVRGQCDFYHCLEHCTDAKNYVAKNRRQRRACLALLDQVRAIWLCWNVVFRWFCRRRLFHRYEWPIFVGGDFVHSLGQSYLCRARRRLCRKQRWSCQNRLPKARIALIRRNLDAELFSTTDSPCVRNALAPAGSIFQIPIFTFKGQAILLKPNRVAGWPRDGGVLVYGLV